MNTDYLIDEYVVTRPGEPYRLFPFGVIWKGGKKRVITPEYASTFRLPHFKPAIKLGSHAEACPAGGHIVGLEVRADGLYALNELNDAGTAAVRDGAYRYQSPEILWDGSGFEDPQTGKLIEGPLIIGDALLHMPHLGEAAALYSVEPVEKETSMADENVSVPKGLWDKITERLDSLFGGAKPEAVTAEIQAVDLGVAPEALTALQVERDQFAAQVTELQAAIDRQAAEQLVVTVRAGIATDLQNPERYGASWVELSKAQEAADVLATMDETARAWVMRQFGALAMQVRESNLTGELGSDGAGAPNDPRQALDVAVRARMAELKIDYNSAITLLAVEKPELFK